MTVSVGLDVLQKTTAISVVSGTGLCASDPVAIASQILRDGGWG